MIFYSRQKRQMSKTEETNDLKKELKNVIDADNSLLFLTD